jgi:hypothetical protein
MLPDILRKAREVHVERYSKAAVLFAAGSFVRGEATSYSDLDLVVVFNSVPNAYRESFRFEGVPVEAFVHDPGTLNYFFNEFDRPSGIPALPQMVKEGVEIPEPNELSSLLKRLATAVLDLGPPPLSADTLQRRRYELSDLLDDLRDPRSYAELAASGSLLYGSLADFYLRSRGCWSAKGKSIPRVLDQSDSGIGDKFCESFERLFKHADPSAAIALTEELLQPTGGLLFDDYRLEAPSAWTQPLPSWITKSQ